MALNHDANPAWLAGYAADTTFIKAVVITYPMLYDQAGTVFDAYQTNAGLLPSIFLVDQEGKIQLRYDIANEPAEFEAHLGEIIEKIDELLEN